MKYRVEFTDESAKTDLRSSFVDWDSSNTVSALVTQPEHARQSERAICPVTEEEDCDGLFGDDLETVTGLITDDFDPVGFLESLGAVITIHSFAGDK